MQPMNNEILVKKKSGDLVVFDTSKLRESLRRVGADNTMIDRVIKETELYIQNGMSTHKIYKKAYSILRKLSNRSAGKYRLKRAIMELGPTGYPFEHFVGSIIKSQGFEVEVGQIIEGNCVTHEVDVVAENENKIIVVECKFHREGNRKSDVKVPLYIRSRFNDIQNRWENEGKIGSRKYEPWVVTNTRFTQDAEKYGKCSGLKLVSWDYPNGNSLRDMIDRAGLHPITSLQNLTKREKQKLVENGIVLCREITKQALIKSYVKPNKISKVMQEVRELVEL